MVGLRIDRAEAASSILLILGLIALLASVFYSSSVLAFMGLGLTFWGALLLYIRPEGYTRKALLNAAILPPLTTLDQMIQELNYRGNAVYLPPRYFANPENTGIYIAKQKLATLPPPELIKEYENRLFVKNPEGLLLTPPGAELAKIFEKKLRTSFTRVNLDYLQRNLPRLLIEDLEIAENVEIEILPSNVSAEAADSPSPVQTFHTVHVRITDSICREICEDTNKLTNICGRIGCPICSSIACALTKAAGSPVMIESSQTSKDTKTTEIVYKILRIKS